MFPRRRGLLSSKFKIVLRVIKYIIQGAKLTRLAASSNFDVPVFAVAFKLSWHVYALFILSAWVLGAFVYI